MASIGDSRWGAITYKDKMKLNTPKYESNDVVITHNNRILYLMEYVRTHVDRTLELWKVYDAVTKQQFEHWLQIPWTRRNK